MSKVNVSFNKSEYLIDKADLEASTSALKNYLLTDMVGSGKTVKFDGVNYNIDATKVAAAVNDFVSYLGTINGTGSKVAIGGVEYSIGSDKLANAISELETVFGKLASSGNMITVLSETTYDNFAYQTDYGVYAAIVKIPYVPMVGETYVVEWDGQSYECPVQDSSSIISDSTCIGNASVLGLAGNNEPFIVAVNNNGYAMICALTNTEASQGHTVAIYHNGDFSNTNGMLMICTGAREFNEYGESFIGASIGLTAGKIYCIEWDGVKYTDVAISMTVADTSGIGIGNFALVGEGEPRDYPFVIGNIETASLFISSDGEPVHTVTIYEVLSDEKVGNLETPLYPTLLATAGFPMSSDDIRYAIEHVVQLGQIVEGETYEVNWDGNIHILQAKNARSIVSEQYKTLFGENDVYLGNAALMVYVGDYLDGIDDTGEHFAVWYRPAQVENNIIFTDDTMPTTHTAAIRKVDGKTQVETMLFASQTIDGFVDGSTKIKAQFVIKHGYEYRVVFDGEEYLCKNDTTRYTQNAPIFSSGIFGCYYHVLGNKSLIDAGDDTGEPFCAELHFIKGESYDYNTFVITCSDSSSTSHDLAIYEVVPNVGTEILVWEQQLSIMDEDGSYYWDTFSEGGELPFTLEENQLYKVIWNGEEYLCFAEHPVDIDNVPNPYAFSLGNRQYVMNGGDATGNGSYIIRKGTGEPFCINLNILVPEIPVWNCEVFPRDPDDSIANYDRTAVYDVKIYKIVE